MKTLALALGAASLAAVTFAHAQSTTGSRTGMNMPYERGFWGHVGASVGRSELDTACPVGPCDKTDQAFRVFAGGSFNNTFGGEIAWVNLGEWQRGGQDTDSQALDLAVTAGFPLGANSSIFGKLGAVYARSEVPAGTAGITQTGKEDGWGPRVGLGAKIGLTDQWALRADWDRYRIKLPGTKENVDTLTVGAQYSFR